MHQDESKICLKNGKFCEDRISALPDDLLVHILSQISTKDVVVTMVLSKRWRLIWTMVYNLDYEKVYNETNEKSVRDFLEKSLKLHKAPVLESLSIQLRKHCPVDAYVGKPLTALTHAVEQDVGKWVSDAVHRCIRELNLDLYVFPRKQILPACLYTCKTLVSLSLFKNILVDVPSPACLPSLQTLELNFVVYKDQDTHVMLLSSCPVLKDLFVVRRVDDNMTSFGVRVPSLQSLTYMDDARSVGFRRSLVIDSPGLRYLKIDGLVEDNFSIHDMPRLDVAFVNVVSGLSHVFLTCFSSVMFLHLGLTKVSFCSAINFSRLIELKLSVDYQDTYWLESLVHLLHNIPKLQVLLINSTNSLNLLPSWNQLSSVPGCLLSHLEIFEWEGYKGRSEEKQFVAFILANSKCLKTVGISPRRFYDVNDNIPKTKEMMMEELKSMYRVSASSQLTFSPQLRWRSYRETSKNKCYRVDL